MELREIITYGGYFESFFDGLYELRIEYNSNIFRIFFIFDEGNIVVLFNGFQKKSQKTPKKEIELALTLKRCYYEDKNGRE